MLWIKQNLRLAALFHSDQSQLHAYETAARRAAESVSRHELSIHVLDQLMVKGLLDIGWVFFIKGNAVRAKEYFYEADRIARRSDLQLSLAKTAYAQAQLYLREGQHGPAYYELKKVLQFEMTEAKHSLDTIAQ